MPASIKERAPTVADRGAFARALSAVDPSGSGQRPGGRDWNSSIDGRETDDLVKDQRKRSKKEPRPLLSGAPVYFGSDWETVMNPIGFTKDALQSLRLD
jgi:hypothetical protein